MSFKCSFCHEIKDFGVKSAPEVPEEYICVDCIKEAKKKLDEALAGLDIVDNEPA